jgi:molybdopterin synthase catalytic subunit
MLRDGLKHGFAQSDWDAAKDEARVVMIERAKIRGMIPYSDLVKKMKSIKLDAHDPRLFHMLGEISSEEDAAGRGMLTVVVVHKVGDMQPGPGFFELAKLLGRDTTNKLRCWADELRKVHEIWSLK